MHILQIKLQQCMQHRVEKNPLMLHFSVQVHIILWPFVSSSVLLEGAVKCKMKGSCKSGKFFSPVELH